MKKEKKGKKSYKKCSNFNILKNGIVEMRKNEGYYGRMGS